jgi:hypothetical protein
LFVLNLDERGVPVREMQLERRPVGMTIVDGRFDRLGIDDDAARRRRPRPRARTALRAADRERPPPPSNRPAKRNKYRPRPLTAAMPTVLERAQEDRARLLAVAGAKGERFALTSAAVHAHRSKSADGGADAMALEAPASSTCIDLMGDRARAAAVRSPNGPPDVLISGEPTAVA